ncbi:MAG: caspase family protein [Brumimicrobium sp.]|nr:caspase family protein [Brumimicrobium sp.]
MRLIWLVFLFLFFYPIYSQDNLIEVSSPIDSYIISNDDSLLIYISEGKIFTTDISKMRVENKFSISKNASQYNWRIIKLTRDKKRILVRREDKRTIYQPKMDIYSYPEDSIFIVDIEKQSVLTAIAGNMFIDITNSGGIIMASNNYRKSENGNISLVGEITSSKSKLQGVSPGIIIDICSHPSKDEFALIYYSYNSKGKKVYSFEVWKENTLELKPLHKRDFDNQLLEVNCSKDGSLWQVVFKDWRGDTRSLFMEEADINLDMEVLELSPFKEKLNYSIYEKSRIYQYNEDEDIEVYNPSSDIIEYKIWPKLSSLQAISGFYPLNNDEILLFNNQDFYTSKLGIEKFSLVQNALYTQQNKDSVKESYLYNQNALGFSINTKEISNARIEQQIDGEWLVIQNGTSVEFWNTSLRKKWRTIHISERTQFFFDSKTMRVLLFEETTTKNYSDFWLSTIDLNTGKKTSRIYENNPYPFPSSSSNSCIHKEGDEWICSGGRGIFTINCRDLSITPIYEFDEKYLSLEVNALINNKLLITLNEKIASQNSYEIKTRNYKAIFNFLDTTFHVIENSIDWEHIYPISESIFAVQKSDGIYVWKNNIQQKIYTPSKNNIYFSQNLVYTKNGVWLADDNSLIFVNYLGVSKKDSSKYLISHLSGSDSLLVFNDAYSRDMISFYPSNSYFKEWKVLKSGFILNPILDITINSNGYIAWKNQLLINIHNLEVDHIANSLDKFFIFPKQASILSIEYTSEIDSKYNTINEVSFIVKEISKRKQQEALLRSPFFKMDDYFSRVLFSEDENYVIAYTDINLFSTKYSFICWNIKANRIVTEKVSAGIITAKNIPNTPLVVFYLQDNSTKTYNMELGKWVHIEIPLINEPIVDYHNVNFQDRNGTYKIFYSDVYLKSAIFIKDINRIVAGSEDGRVYVWDIDNSSPEMIIPTGATAPIVNLLTYSEFIIAIDAVGALHFINKNDMVWKVTIDIIGGIEGDAFSMPLSVVWRTSEGYYSSEKSNLKYFNIIRGKQIIPSNSYDVLLNRPDKVLEVISSDEIALINALKEAFEKRIKRNYLSKIEDILTVSLPEVKFANSFVPPFTTQDSFIDIPIENSSNSVTLEVRDNGVLIYDMPIQDIEKNLRLELVSGENAIYIITKDENGFESIPITFQLICEKEVQPKLYYIGIGVSKYQDTLWNLKYAVKDIEKLKEFFSYRYANQAEIYTFLDEEVISENLIKIKEILSQTSVDDKVVISFSGHGLIGRDKEFIFCSNNIDFSKPEERGIKFSFIKDLIKDIPARRRLILIDACNSGALDEEENINMTLADNIKEYNSKGITVVEGYKQEKFDSYDLMQRYFFDFQHNDGSYIISASGGKEYSYEGEEWGNGVFTYSLIKILEEKNYFDKKETAISILQKRVYEMVESLTKGKQKPTSRNENPEWNWGL